MKETCINHVKVEVICPHCETDVSEVWNTEKDYNICPKCGAEFWEGYEEMVTFILERKNIEVP